MTAEQIELIEETARSLRIAALATWDQGEIEASEVMRNRARRLEQELRNHDRTQRSFEPSTKQ